MSLNIKNERVHDLARTAAQVTGKTKTGVIEEALVLLLAKYDADPEETEKRRTVARMLEIGRRFREEEPPLPAASDAIRCVDDLYDPETGLPR